MSICLTLHGNRHVTLGSSLFCRHVEFFVVFLMFAVLQLFILLAWMYTVSMLTSIFIKNSVVEFTPRYVRNISPNWRQSLDVVWANLFLFDDAFKLDHPRTLKVVISRIYVYFVKLSRHCTTQVPLKRTFRVTCFKAFTQSVEECSQLSLS